MSFTSDERAHFLLKRADFSTYTKFMCANTSRLNTSSENINTVFDKLNQLDNKIDEVDTKLFLSSDFAFQKSLKIKHFNHQALIAYAAKLHAATELIQQQTSAEEIYGMIITASERGYDCSDAYEYLITSLIPEVFSIPANKNDEYITKESNGKATIHANLAYKQTTVLNVSERFPLDFKTTTIAELQARIFDELFKIHQKLISSKLIALAVILSYLCETNNAHQLYRELILKVTSLMKIRCFEVATKAYKQINQ